MLPVAILAGGLATRLRPETETVPKALIEVAGRPFIFHQLELLQRQHIERVVLCVGYLGDQVVSAVGDGKEFGLSIAYSFERGTLLGTGGALVQALPLLGESFFVLYGDSYLTSSFVAVQAAYEAARYPALMTVFRNSDRWEKSNVLFRNGKLVEYNKSLPRPDMAHVDYGLGILSANAFRGYSKKTVFDLADLYRELSLEGKVAGFEVDERFYEIGSRQGIRETEYFLSTKEGSR